MREDGTVVMGQRLCVPDVGDVRREIMEEAHLCYASGKHKDVSYPKGTLLVEGHVLWSLEGVGAPIYP